MPRSFALLSFAPLSVLVLLAGACGDGVSVRAGHEPTRCTGAGDTFLYDTGVSDPTAEEAVARAQREAALEGLAFTEATSNVWVAGESAIPEAIIEVAPQGTRAWFISSVTTCEDGESAEPAGEAFALAHRVLVDGAATGEVYDTDVATGDEDFNALWSRLGLAGPVPEVDFGSAVVLYFGAVESGSCPLGEVEAVVFDETNRRIYPDIPLAGAKGATDVCTSDANVHGVLVAVDRVHLPDGEFSIWIDASDPPACCAGGVTVITGDDLVVEG